MARVLARRLSSSSDADYMARLQQRLPSLYEATLPQFAPMWTAMATAVANANASPRIILDLASGAGEPALTLARRFPDTEVVASDRDEGVLSIARRRIASEFADPPGRVTAHQIDLASLSTLAGDGGGGGLECSAVTCSLGLFMLPREAQEPCLRGIHQLLAPGGHLCASVWEGPTVPLMELGQRCMAAVLECDAPPTLPFDPASLGGGRADAALAAAGFCVYDVAAHNATGELRLALGPASTDEAWMVGLLPYVSALATLSARGHADVFARARAAFEAEVERGEHASVDAATGKVVLAPMRYRLLSAFRSGRSGGARNSSVA